MIEMQTSHSAAELLSNLRRQKVIVRLDGEQVRFSAPQDVLTPALKELLAAHKGELQQLLRDEQRKIGSTSPIPALPRPSAIPLSFAQQRLWFLDQLEPGLTAYNGVAAYRLRGVLDLAALQRSLDEILRRHESLRTTFQVHDGQPWQVIQPATKFPLIVHDFSQLPAAAWDAEVERQLLVERNRPFDLAQDLMRRAALLRFGEQEHVLLLTTHHIATDGWSSGVFVRELAALYAAFVKDESANLPTLPIQYADYAIWQREWLTGDRLKRQLDYWRGQLADIQLLELPTDHPRPATYSYRGQRLHFSLPPDLVTKLRSIARAEGATLYMTLLAAFFVLLYRQTGQDDITVGSPIANRNRLELEDLIGFFANTLVVRGDLSGNPTFRELLRRVRWVALDAYEHQDLPFEKLVEELQPERNLNRNPLFQVLFQLLADAREALTLLDLDVERLPFNSESTRFDLELHLYESGNALTGNLVYCSDLFERVTAEGLANRFRVILEGIASNSDQTIDMLPVLTPEEEDQLLVEWNDTDAEFSWGGAIHEQFEAQVRRTPRAVAVSFGRESITYHELDYRANQLAHYLQALGVKPDVPVGIYTQRSIETIIGLLAILKAGGAYVPLDVAQPQQRLAFMVQNTQVSVLLVRRGFEPNFTSQKIQIIHLDSDPHQFAHYPGSAPNSSVHPKHLAYVIHTSGSTGQPKGVAMSHGALVNLLAWHQSHPSLATPERTLQYTPLSFDVSFQEIFSTWCAGGTLVMVDDETRRDPHLLCALLRAEGIERLYAPMTALQQLAEAIITSNDATGYRLRTVITAGEQVRITPAIRRMMALLPECTLHNHYGPTESHVATEHLLSGDLQTWPELPPIGRPIANVCIYILDAQRQLLPIGAFGELYIGGAGLARGYFNRPELTAEKFVPHPFRPGERLYRTGDLARWRWDGILEYVGRVDDQIKIRGYRVEPGEIEATLALHPAVSACAVAFRAAPTGDMCLAAYFTSVGTGVPTSSELSRFLRASLPDYMIPSVFVQLDALPLTSSGKVDRRSLPEPDAVHTPLTNSEDLPTNPTEEKLAAIWVDILGLPQVGIHDSFFDLGGHSLLAVRLFHRIEEVFGVRLPLALLFRAQTIAELAPHLEMPIPQHEWRTLVTIQAGADRPPFFCVHGFGGGVMGYADLARLLGPGQPFYGLQAAGLNGDEPPDLCIEEMATRYIDAIRSVQPHGPYRLGGYCFGGVVAFELARQLETQGERVALLAIMEGYAPGMRRRRGALLDTQRLLTIWRNLPYWLEDYSRLGARGIRLRAQRKLRQWRRRFLQRTESTPAIDVRDVLPDDAAFVPDHHRRIMEIHLRAMRDYRPTPYNGAVTLFAAHGRTISSALSGSLDPQRGWGALALGGVTVHVVEGGHRNIHLPPYVSSLAAALEGCLQKCR